MTIRRRLLVSGDVQGVFYRDTCRQVAQDAGVSGWARNLPDGRVEVCLEGDAEAVRRVEEWCHKGTRYAEVDSIESHDEEPSGEGGFSIR